MWAHPCILQFFHAYEASEAAKNLTKDLKNVEIWHAMIYHANNITAGVKKVQAKNCFKSCHSNNHNSQISTTSQLKII